VSKLYALVLAAGLGARFGGRKMLSPWRGGVLLDGALAAAFNAPVEGVVVVVGADGDEVAEAARARAMALGHADRLTIARNADYAQGLASSLKTGLAGLPDDAAGVLVFLGDMPLVPPAVAAQLAAALSSGAPAAAPVRRGRRGHPVALSRSLFALLASLAGDQGARGVLDALGQALVLVVTNDDGVLIDVDRPEDRPA